MDNKDYYKENSDVIELCGDDFQDAKIENKKFKGKFGLLKAYAPWCGFCKRFIDDMNFLATNLKNEDFAVGAINCDSYKELGKKIGVTHYPYLFQVFPDGSLKKMDLEGGRNVESVLKNICQFTNEVPNKKGKCCKRIGNKLECN